MVANQIVNLSANSGSHGVHLCYVIGDLSMLKKVKLHGILGEKFGTDFELDVESVAGDTQYMFLLPIMSILE